MDTQIINDYLKIVRVHDARLYNISEPSLVATLIVRKGPKPHVKICRRVPTQICVGVG